MKECVVDFIGSDMHTPKDIIDMARLFNAADLKLLREQPLLNGSLFTKPELAK
jgi:protein-tyrosine phosphatase